MVVKVKICGITDKISLESAINNGADYIGFVLFDKSPRNLTIVQIKELFSYIPHSIKKVIVVVNKKEEELFAIIEQVRPDYIQLHGDENLEYISKIKNKFKDLGIIKAIKVRNADDIAQGLKYEKVVDMLLFDAKADKSLLPGGNGLSFDWQLLRNRVISVPWFLSGGLNLQNIQDAISITGANMIDVSSSLEFAPGKKDPELIKLFMKKVR